LAEEIIKPIRIDLKLETFGNPFFESLPHRSQVGKTHYEGRKRGQNSTFSLGDEEGEVRDF
jgi:hypothetical protein